MNRITKADFDNAVKQKWSRTTCVAAQMILRVTGKPPSDSWNEKHVREIWDQGWGVKHAGHKVVAVFDQNFSGPGDEKKKALRDLRASLPVTIS